MTIQLLPSDFDEKVQDAVRVFWASRSTGSSIQGGTRGKVIPGKNLDGFLSVVQSVARHCGLPDSSVFTSGRRDLTLPGYYRPTKNWDVVIVHGQRLLAVLEFKSQVGSFGNNFNNRTEEVIGNASDLWVAAQHGAYLPSNHTSQPMASEVDDPRPPFLGYLMLLESCEKSMLSVKTNSPHYKVAAEFAESSYADRYRILCERLMKQNLYKAAALMLSPQDDSGRDGCYNSLSDATSVRNLYAQLAGQLLAGAQG